MQRQKGFTLMELMVAIVVLAIIVSVAAPSFTKMMDRNRSRTVAESLVSAFVAARTAAISQGVPVTLCPSSDADACATGAQATWTAGWLLFQDETTTNNGIPSVLADGKIKYFDPIHERVTVSVVPVRTFVRFLPRGVLAGSVAGLNIFIADSRITYHVEPTECEPGMAWDVIVTARGQALIEAADCAQ